MRSLDGEIGREGRRLASGASSRVPWRVLPVLWAWSMRSRGTSRGGAYGLMQVLLGSGIFGVVYGYLRGSSLAEGLMPAGTGPRASFAGLLFAVFVLGGVVRAIELADRRHASVYSPCVAWGASRDFLFTALHSKAVLELALSMMILGAAASPHGVFAPHERVQGAASVLGLFVAAYGSGFSHTAVRLMAPGSTRSRWASAASTLVVLGGGLVTCAGLSAGWSATSVCALSMATLAASTRSFLGVHVASHVLPLFVARADVSREKKWRFFRADVLHPELPSSLASWFLIGSAAALPALLALTPTVGVSITPASLGPLGALASVVGLCLAKAESASGAPLFLWWSSGRPVLGWMLRKLAGLVVSVLAAWCALATIAASSNLQPDWNSFRFIVVSTATTFVVMLPARLLFGSSDAARRLEWKGVGSTFLAGVLLGTPVSSVAVQGFTACSANAVTLVLACVSAGCGLLLARRLPAGNPRIV